MSVRSAFDIIYLGGPSSSGKTTLAKALQEKFPDPWLRVGIDQVIGMTPAKLHDWTGGGPKEGCFWRAAVDPTGHPIQELQTGPFGKRQAELFHDLVLFLASKGWRLVIDDVPLSQGEVNRWKQLLADFRVLYVGLSAPIELLEERERMRGDRLAGGARGQYYLSSMGYGYDLIVDAQEPLLAQVDLLHSHVYQCD